MTDLARLGFSADTSALDKAGAALKQLVPAAEKTAAAVNKVSAASAGITGPMNGAAAGIKSFDTAVKAAAAGTGGLSRGALLAGSAMGTVQSMAVGAAAGLNVVGAAASRAGVMFQAADAHVEAYKATLAGVPAAANAAKSGLDRLGAAANDNINRLQSTPGNIAAQFQDIGVTAAAGMNPLLIALQQGTQLSSAMAGGIRPVIEGFLQLFSATTILTIGLVGLAAAGLQMIDWVSVGQAALNGLATAMEVAAPYAAALGATLLLAFAPQILTGIATMTVAIGGALVTAITSATGALIAFAVVNPFTALILGIALVVALMYGLNDVFGGVFSDILSIVDKGVNYIIGFFVGGFNAIRATWSQLPAALGDVVYSTANMVLKGIEDMVNGAISRINALTAMLPLGLGEGLQMGNVALGMLDNANVGAMRKVAQTWGVETGKAAGKAARGEYTTEIIGGVRDAVKGAAGWLRGISDGMGGAADGKAGPKGRTPREAKGPKAEKTIDEKFNEILADASKQARALDQVGSQIGVYGEALAQLKYQQELFNAAQDKGIPIIDAATGKLNSYGQRLLEVSQALAGKDERNRTAQFIEDMAVGLDKQQRALNQSRDEIGLTGAALAAYRFEQELLNSAIEKRITLSPSELGAIKKAAEGYGQQTEEIRKMNENLEFVRTTAKDFFFDFFNGIREGQSLIKSFGDAVLNTLNLIIDKLVNTFLDNFLNNLKLPGFGSSSVGSNSLGGGAAVPNAKGNAFGDSGIMPFARGGIVSSPTLFAFGKGGANLGIMGEAGEEAILPLKRGPDGSLGVQAGGAGGGGVVNQTTVNVQNDYKLEGAIGVEAIMRAIQQGGERTKQEVRRALMSDIAQIQRDGATV